MSCYVEGCTRPLYARGLCMADYQRLRKYGDPYFRRTFTRIGEANRFWSKVDKTGDCWIWTGGKHASGYGKFWRDDGRAARPHRWSYENANGPIPDGLDIDHRCHNDDPACVAGVNCRHRLCVNPDHLEAVTPKVNNARGRTVGNANLAKTHCPAGHPYDEANTYRIPPNRVARNGGRGCVTCRKENTERHLARKKAEREANPPPSKPRQEACKHGHPFTPENTYMPPGKNVRMCRTCRNEASRRRAAKRRVG